MLIFLFLFRLYSTGGCERAVDERLNIARIYLGRAPRHVSKNFNLREFTYDGSKILKGFTHFIPNKQFLKPSLISTLCFLKQESALHPYGVRIYIGRAPRRVSKNFNLHEFTYDGLKILKGFTHFIPNMAKEAILETINDFHAVLPETGVRIPVLMECQSY